MLNLEHHFSNGFGFQLNNLLKVIAKKNCNLTRLIMLLTLSGWIFAAQISAQMTGGTPVPYYPPSTGNFSPAQTNYAPANNYLKNSAAFRQEIVRMEINVVRGTQTLPITQVPRVQKDDIIKMKLLDEAVGGIRPSDSLYDWTFLVAFVNPNRRAVVDGDEAKSKGSAVSQEVRFKKTGWYKQYSFSVPYDSQPVFFLYPKANYRSKILKVVSRNYNEVRKLGDKTIEIAGAYAKISSFLNELQTTLIQSQQSRYYNNHGYNNETGASPYGTYNPYNPGNTSYNPYNPGTSYNPYNPYPTYGTTPGVVSPPLNYNLFLERTIEHLAKSFNIQMPSCWGNGATGNNGSSYNSPYTGGYTSPTYNTNPTNYSSPYGSGSGSNSTNFGYMVSQELFARAQCVAKNIRIEDFDLSIASMLQQGGIMAATYLRDKYPQFAYWINLAAAAIDFIVKVFQKAALRIVPTMVQSSDTSKMTSGGGPSQLSYAMQNGTIIPYSPYSTNLPNQLSPAKTNNPPAVKIALYAESQPDTNGFVTAYPIVVHKWQQEPDPQVISLPPPVLAEPCLHVGINILKNTIIGEEPEADTFTKDFKLVVSGSNGFKKEFPLKKNIGLGGWELTLSKEDLNSFPRVQMNLESYIAGTRGFNEIKSPAFELPIPIGGAYELALESQKAMIVGGKRTVVIRNPLGGCQCLQAVIYKPAFGGQFVYEANAKDNNRLNYSPDGRAVSFEIDAAAFQPGAGQLTLLTYSGEQTNLNLRFYPSPPNVTNIKMARGDNQAIITGERLEQLQYLRINGKRATIIGNTGQRANANPTAGYQNQQSYQGQSSYPNQNQGQMNYQAANQSGFQPNPQTNQGLTNYSQNQANQNPPSYLSTDGRLTNVYQQPGAMQVQQGPPALIRQPDGNGSLPNTNYVSVMPATTLPSQAISQASVSTTNDSPTAVPAAAIANKLSDSAVSLAANERIAVFDDPNQQLAESQMSVELGLEDDRTFPLEKTFPSLPSRPAVITDNRSREIEAQIENDGANTQNANPIQASLDKVLPVETSKLSFTLRNALTDYDFKIENLTIETRIESSRIRQNANESGFANPSGNYTADTSSNANFGGNSTSGRYTSADNPGMNTSENLRTFIDVLDWKNLRVRFEISETLRKIIGGRRIQFRLHDRERGDSDWYTIRQTFIRIPHIESVVCTSEMNGQCQLAGTNLDYLGQVSVDGGTSWFPSNNGAFPVAVSAGGVNLAKTILIPRYSTKKLLILRFRDFPALNMPADADYKFSNTVKATKKPNAGKNTATPVNSPIKQSLSITPLSISDPSRLQGLQGDTSPPSMSKVLITQLNKQTVRT